MTKDFKRVHNALDIIISSALVIAGVITVIIPSSVGVNILGCCLAFCGVILFFNKVRLQRLRLRTMFLQEEQVFSSKPQVRNS